MINFKYEIDGNTEIVVSIGSELVPLSVRV